MNNTIKIDKTFKKCYNIYRDKDHLNKKRESDFNMKWTTIPTDEKETLLNFDYFENKVNLYTTNQATGNRLKKKIGEPSKTNYFEGKIASEEWTIPFKEREKLRKIFSINLFVSSYLSEGDSQETN